jgi:protein O-mannosyl-transferase
MGNRMKDLEIMSCKIRFRKVFCVTFFGASAHNFEMHSYSHLRCKVGLLVAVLIVFGPVLSHSFLQLDDPKHIFENPLILDPSWEHFWQFWRAPFFSLYIPVTYSVWEVTGKLFGVSPRVFHALSLLLHSVNVLLVFHLVERALLSTSKEDSTSTTRGAALMAALLFAWHPLQVESVAWISALKDLLSTFFVLLVLEFSTRSVRSLRDWCFASLAFVSALLSKPSAIVTPMVVLVYDVFLLERSFKESLGWVAAWALALPLVFLTSHLQPVASSGGVWRLVTAFEALGFYLQKIAVPLNLQLDYGLKPWGRKSDPYLWARVGLFGMALGAIVKSGKGLRGRGALLIAALGLLPVLGLVPFQFQKFSTVANRYAYFPLFGLSLWLGLVWKEVPRWGRQGLVLLVVAGGFLSVWELRFWEDSVSLFSRAVESNPESSLANTNLGFSLMGEGRPGEAIRFFQKSVELEPKAPEMWLNLGSAWAAAGALANGEKYFREALRLQPGLGAAERNLAEILRREGKGEAAAIYR